MGSERFRCLEGLYLPCFLGMEASGIHDTTSRDEQISLQEYGDRMKEGQNDNLYTTGRGGGLVDDGRAQTQQLAASGTSSKGKRSEPRGSCSGRSVDRLSPEASVGAGALHAFLAFQACTCASWIVAMGFAPLH